MERDGAGVKISQQGLQARHSHHIPALDHCLEAAGGSAILVLLHAVLEVETEKGRVVTELSEDPGPQCDLAGFPLSALPGSVLPGLPVERLPVLPQCRPGGQE